MPEEVKKCFAIFYLILSFKLVQDNDFPVLAEHMRDSGPQQASKHAKASHCWLLDFLGLAVFFRVHVLSRFTLESVLVSKSPPR